MKQLLIVLLFVAAPVAAQTSVPANAVLTLAADHDGANTDGYRVYVDGVKVSDVPKTALVAGVLTATVPAQKPGPHTVQLAAYNAVAEVKSDPVTFTALQTPLKPSNLKLTWTVTISGP